MALQGDLYGTSLPYVLHVCFFGALTTVSERKTILFGTSSFGPRGCGSRQEYKAGLHWRCRGFSVGMQMRA